MRDSNVSNAVTLRGNLGQDVEYFNFGEGKTLAKFRLATNKVYYNSEGEKVKSTTWHNIVAWGQKADIAAKILTKGAGATIFGELIKRDYVDKSGSKRSHTEVKINDFMLWSLVKTDAGYVRQETVPF